MIKSDSGERKEGGWMQEVLGMKRRREEKKNEFLRKGGKAKEEERRCGSWFRKQTEGKY